MHRVDKKSSLRKKKIKIAHNFFMTKVTDLKTIFLKIPWKMYVETWATLWYFFKQNKNIFHIFKNFSFAFFFNPP